MQCSSTAVWGKGSLLHRGQACAARSRPRALPSSNDASSARASPQPRPRDPTIVRPARDMHESRRHGSDHLSYISKFKTLPGPDGGRAECVTRESTQNTALQRAATRSFLRAHLEDRSRLRAQTHPPNVSRIARKRRGLESARRRAPHAQLPLGCCAVSTQGEGRVRCCRWIGHKPDSGAWSTLLYGKDSVLKARTINSYEHAQRRQVELAVEPIPGRHANFSCGRACGGIRKA
jgi:hypothetical protein